MPNQKKEPTFGFTSLEGRVYAMLEERNANSGNVTNLLLLAILRELERISNPRGKK